MIYTFEDLQTIRASIRSARASLAHSQAFGFVDPTVQAQYAAQARTAQMAFEARCEAELHTYILAGLTVQAIREGLGLTRSIEDVAAKDGE